MIAQAVRDLRYEPIPVTARVERYGAIIHTAARLDDAVVRLVRLVDAIPAHTLDHAEPAFTDLWDACVDAGDLDLGRRES